MASWVKGQSGNPGGRPRVAGVIRDLARADCEDAYKKIAAIMRGPDPGPALAASKMILKYAGVERALGAEDGPEKEELRDDIPTARLLELKRGNGGA
jgi:hypothetical protein